MKSLLMIACLFLSMNVSAEMLCWNHFDHNTEVVTGSKILWNQIGQELNKVIEYNMVTGAQECYELTDDLFVQGNEYCFKVTDINQVGESEFSAPPVCATLILNVPSAPTNVLIQ